MMSMEGLMVPKLFNMIAEAALLPAGRDMKKATDFAAKVINTLMKVGASVNPDTVIAVFVSKGGAVIEFESDAAMTVDIVDEVVRFVHADGTGFKRVPFVFDEEKEGGGE